MNPVHVITRKRDGQELDRAEIADFIRGFVDGSIPNHQMSALAMAIYFRGMTDLEIASLTQEMVASGVRLQWSAGPTVVDKHSTGGVGDKTSLILAPLLAECGLRVPKISGRGLGPTGGTLDKLEAIPGFRTSLSIQEMQAIVDDVGCVINGATKDLVPADRKLYALRDVTGTVPSIPLLTSSIMCKKLAESLEALVLDVKWGNGAFMTTPTQAEELARSMVRVGNLMGVKTAALITDMNQPLGRMCGNTVEVKESLDCLAGEGPADLKQLVVELASEMLLATKLAADLPTARERILSLLSSGKARERFERMVAAQGGKLSELTPTAPETMLIAKQAGYIRSIDTAALGRAIIDLGGGRQQLGDSIDHSVGIEMLVRKGGEVQIGDPIARVFARNGGDAAIEQIREAIMIADERPRDLPLIAERINSFA